MSRPLHDLSPMERETELRLRELLALMPFRATAPSLPVSPPERSIDLAFLATWLAAFREHFGAVAERTDLVETELAELQAEVAAAGRLLRRLLSP